jgi:hypothetical protein
MEGVVTGFAADATLIARKAVSGHGETFVSFYINEDGIGANWYSLSYVFNDGVTQSRTRSSIHPKRSSW